MIEVSSAYKLFWVGKPKAEGSVGFAVKNTISIFVKLRIQLQCGQYATLFSVNAPTFQADEETVLTFYGALRTLTVSMPNENELIIFGDFNARVCRDFEIWNVFDCFGIGKVDANRLNQLEL